MNVHVKKEKTKLTCIDSGTSSLRLDAMSGCSSRRAEAAKRVDTFESLIGLLNLGGLADVANFICNAFTGDDNTLLGLV